VSEWADIARQEGYACRPGLLDPALITALRGAVIASLALRGLSNLVAIQRDIMPLELVSRLRNDPSLTDSLTAILGAGLAPIHADVLRIVAPGEPPTPPHKDADYLAQDPLWIAWIPLDDCPIERGPLVVWPSTAPRPIPCSMGDAIFFSSRTEHAALPNTSHAPRLSIDFRYSLTQPREVR